MSQQSEIDRPATTGDWAELTGGDVWEAVKGGLLLWFYPGVIAGVGAIFLLESFPAGVKTFCACLLFGLFVHAPLKLAVQATARSRRILPRLLRGVNWLLSVGLAVFFGLLLLARVLIFILHVVLKSSA